MKPVKSAANSRLVNTRANDLESINTGALAKRWLLGAALAAASLTSVAQTDRIELPEIGESSQVIVSPRFEKEYGEQLIRQMRAYNVLIDDPQIQAFFADMGYRLVANSDKPDKHFTFVVIDEPSINAFAAPGGVVALHTGLILAASTESEVAGVLAHEVSHVTQLHLARAVENARKVTIPTMLAMLGLILAAGGSGDAIQGALLGGQAIAAQSQINFTRQNEHEADRIGIMTLSKAGYDPDGMAAFFGKLGRLTRANGEGPPEFLRTHPVTTTRIAEAKNRAALLPKSRHRENVDFYLMQARLRAMEAQYPEQSVRYFNHQLEVAEFTPISQQANQYGLSIAYQRLGQYQKSAALIDRLLRDHPDQLAYQIQKAELDTELRDYAAAIARLTDLYARFRGNHVIAIHLVRSLLRDGSDESAEFALEILRDELLEHNDDPALFDLYAQASTLAEDEVRAGEAIAEAHYLRGRLHQAVLQLRDLTKRPDLDYYQRARITARLSELEIQLAETGRPEFAG